MTEQLITKEMFKGLLFAEALGKEEIKRVQEHAFQVDYSAGRMLVENGALCQNVYWVMDGLIRIFRMTDDGKEITYYRVGKGEACLFTMSCILDHEPFEAIAQIEKDARLLALPGYIFEDLMQGNARFRQFIFKKLLSTIGDLMMLTEEVTFHSINKRLANFLLVEKDKQRKEALTITHESIGHELGTAREVISRMLKEFEKKGWVSLSRGKITLVDIEALREIGLN